MARGKGLGSVLVDEPKAVLQSRPVVDGGAPASGGDREQRDRVREPTLPDGSKGFKRGRAGAW